MVDSVALHSVNVGPELRSSVLGGVSPLPPELEKLSKHSILPDTLARAILQIQNISGGDTSQWVLQMEYCAFNLLSWAYYHWHGVLSVISGNKTIFHDSMGSNNRLLKVFITAVVCESNCSDTAHKAEIRIFPILSYVGSQPTPRPEDWAETSLFQGSRQKCWEHHGTYPLKLYDVVNPYIGRSLLKLNKSELVMAKGAAQLITKSIVKTRIRPTKSTLALRVDKDSDMMFEYLVKVTPTLFQLPFYDVKETGGIPYRALFDPDQDDDMINVADSILDSETFSVDIVDVINRYPEIGDAMSSVAKRCGCGCDPNEQNTGEGCLQMAVMAEIVLHVGHAMAEAAGARHISNFSTDPEGRTSLLKATIRLLDNIASQGIILWGDWFRLAATAITGIPSSLGLVGGLDDAGEVLGCTFGPVSVFASWVAMDEELGVQGCWGVRELLGCPKGIVGEKAFFKPQVTNGATPAQTPALTLVTAAGLVSKEEVTLESAVLQASGFSYRLMTLVKSTNSLRCMNPNDIYKSLIHAHRPRCNHDPSNVAQSPKEAHCWGVNDILQQWGLVTHC